MLSFARLLAIYVAIFLAIFAVFNRDKVMHFLNFQQGTQPPAVAETSPEMPEATPQVETTPASAEQAPAPRAEPLPVEQPKAEAPKYASEDMFQPKAPDPATSPSTLKGRWSEARQSYWSGDIRNAEAQFLALITDHAGEPDLKGELGNLYFTQGRYEDSAMYFHLAGKQLLDRGETAQVMSIIGVLQSIAPDKANDLRALAAAKQ